MHKHFVSVAVAIVALGSSTPTASADELESFNPSPSPGVWMTVPSTAPSNWLVGKLASGSTALLETNIGDVTCTVSTARGQVIENPGNPAAGLFAVDDVEETITHLSFTSCTDSSSLFNLRNCTDKNQPVVTYPSFLVRADADTAVDVFGLSSIHVDVCIDPVLGIDKDCKYSGTANGSIVGSQVIFEFEPVTTTTGFPCPTSSTFTATYDVKHDVDADGLYEAGDRNVRLTN